MNRIVAFGCSNTFGTSLPDATAAWPHVLADLYNCKVDNRGIEGASNLQILWNILQYDFKPGDTVVIMWAIVNRDFFEGTNQFGVWQDASIVDHWIAVHSEKDMIIRAWLNIHHADLHLKQLNIPHYNFAVDYRLLNKNKLKFINTTLYNARVDLYKFINRASDKSHPGEIAHRNIAKKIKKIINENRH
jgi:hypothetical protein